MKKKLDNQKIYSQVASHCNLLLLELSEQLTRSKRVEEKNSSHSLSKAATLFMRLSAFTSFLENKLEELKEEQGFYIKKFEVAELTRKLLLAKQTTSEKEDSTLEAL
jgi:hypothetical protein